MMLPIHIPIGEFKTHCYQFLGQAQKNSDKLIITRRGVQIAEVLPISSERKKPIIGLMQGQAEIKGDIVGPIETKWDAANEQ